MAGMHPRLRLDVGPVDLAYALAAVANPRPAESLAGEVEHLLDPSGRALATLSARSALDLHLGALALPAGSEVLVSGLTIPHVPAILEAHGLRVVPYALDPLTLAPARGELERLGTPRTRALLHAHLFGQRSDLDGAAALARRSGWLLWEDCAQAWTGDAWRGRGDSDLVLFSFGLIKTATAVRGGAALVRDREVLARMRRAHASWPLQARSDQLRRVLRAAGLAALGGPRTFALFARACAASGRDLDAVLHAATRGFPGATFLERLRARPSVPLLALMGRRLRHPERCEAGARRAWCEALLAELGDEAAVLGRDARERHHWVLAVTTDEPAGLVGRLRALGFDASARSSLVAVAPTGGGDPPAACTELLERLVYVPIAQRARARERRELVRVLRAEWSVHELRPPRAQDPVPSAQPPGG